MSSIRLAINGFGRIGRSILRILANEPSFKAGELEVVALNDLADPETMAYLFKYDSVHGVFRGESALDGKSLRVNGRSIPLLAEPTPGNLPWKQLGADIVLECTGRFKTGTEAGVHRTAGCRKVIISAPAKEVDATVVVGVNDHLYDPKQHHVISNASCTTNCLAPIAKVVHEKFKIRNGFMTTIHSYTNDQRLLDLPHADLRRARAAALNMIPTTTGAAKAVGLVLPELKGKVDGISIRVPTPNVSLVDFVATVERSVTPDEINAEIKRASEGPLKGIVHYLTEPCVSGDFNGTTYSAILDSDQTSVIDERLVKLLAWYDNETGFSARMVDLVRSMAKAGL